MTPAFKQRLSEINRKLKGDSQLKTYPLKSRNMVFHRGGSQLVRITPIILDEEGKREMNVVRCKLHVYRKIEMGVCLRKKDIMVDMEESMDKKDTMMDGGDEVGVR